MRAHQRRRGRDGLDPAAARRISTSSSTARRSCRSTRRSTRRSTPTSAARIGLYGAPARAKGDPHVVHVSTCYVGGHPQGRRARGVAHPRRRLARRVRRREDGPRRASSSSRASPTSCAEFMDAAQGQARQGGPAGGRPAQRGGPRRLGARASSSTSAARAPRASAGPTSTRSPRRSPSAPPRSCWGETGHRLSVVRPAIIESALQHPFPGWIDGFKVADPLIIAYGRGLLPEFPGLPDCDPRRHPGRLRRQRDPRRRRQPAAESEPEYYHVASGASNPLPFHEMYELRQRVLHREPDARQDGQGHRKVPTWKFPGGNKVETRARRARSARSCTGSRRCLERMPRRRPGAPAGSTQMLKSIADLETLRDFTELYRAYVQTEIIFDDTQHRAPCTPPSRRRCRPTAASTSPRSTGSTTCRRAHPGDHGADARVRAIAAGREGAEREPRSPLPRAQTMSWRSSTSRARSSTPTSCSSTSCCARGGVPQGAPGRARSLDLRRSLRGLPARRAPRPRRVHPHVPAPLRGHAGRRDSRRSCDGGYAGACTRHTSPEALQARRRSTAPPGTARCWSPAHRPHGRAARWPVRRGRRGPHARARRRAHRLPRRPAAGRRGPRRLAAASTPTSTARPGRVVRLRRQPRRPGVAAAAGQPDTR